MFALSASGLVHAVDWQVTNCKDDGSTGSLRWAAANANGVSLDTINLNTISDFSLCAANLTGGGGIVTHSIEVASTITLATGGVRINGPGPSNLAITALNGNFRVFSAPGALSVYHLQVMYAQPNKNVGAYYGGCIYAKNKLTLADVQLTHCYLTNTGSAKGGAAASALGDVYMSDVDIVRTSATSTFSGDAMGGAVYAHNDVDMISSSIYPGAGGRVHAYVTGGSGDALGGAIHSGRYVYMSNSIISTPRAYVTDTTGGSASGGAIWARGAVTMTAASKISGGIAKTASTAGANSYGGGVYSGGGVSLYTSRVTGSGTSSTSGLSKGGGTFANGFTSLNYAYIGSNTSQRGGGVYASSGFESYYSYFWNNSATQFGGAVDLSAGLANVRGTTVTYNRAGLCCSGFDFNAGYTNSVKVTQSTIAYNTGTAALYARALSTKIYNSTIAYNANGTSITPGLYVAPGNPGSTLIIASNLMSGNVAGASTQDDFHAAGNVIVGGDHNLIRTPDSAPPAGTITGKCPLLYPGNFGLFNLQDQFTIRHEVKSPATDAGSNPLNLEADQRGGAVGATSPPRVSGEPGTTAKPDIGAYEINGADEVFDNRFETCT